MYPELVGYRGKTLVQGQENLLTGGKGPVPQFDRGARAAGGVLVNHLIGEKTSMMGFVEYVNLMSIENEQSITTTWVLKSNGRSPTLSLSVRPQLKCSNNLLYMN